MCYLCQRTRAEQAEALVAALQTEVERLRSILDRCHEAVGEDRASDDETLPDGIAEMFASLHTAEARGRKAGMEKAAAMVRDHRFPLEGSGLHGMVVCADLADLERNILAASKLKEARP